MVEQKALKVKDRSGGWVCPNDLKYIRLFDLKGWLAIAKLKPLSLFISLLLMLKKAFDNVKIEK